LFEEIHKNYGETIPSDENLRSFLLRKGFLQAAVDSPIRAYRETIGLVNSLPKAENGGISEEHEEPDMDTPSVQGSSTVSLPRITAKGAAAQSLPNGKQVGSAIPVAANCSMTIIADGEVTQAGLERLVAYINLIKDWFPKDQTQTVQ
jgi:hypothetical protein